MHQPHVTTWVYQLSLHQKLDPRVEQWNDGNTDIKVFMKNNIYISRLFHNFDYQTVTTEPISLDQKYRPTHKETRKRSEFISTKKQFFRLKSRGFWCCERFGLNELGPWKSYSQFFQWKIEGGSESIIEKLCDQFRVHLCVCLLLESTGSN